MSATAAEARPNPVFTWLGRAADAVARHVVVAVVAIVAFQVLATVALFFSVNRNDWLTYQGGDQIWLVTSGWLLGKGMMGYALTGHGWPMLLAPLTWITGSSSVQLLPLTTVLQVGVLAPIATLAVYDIGARLAGRLAGVWCAAAFAVAPFVAIPYFVQRYHDSWVDQFLPQALGLTQQADFPSVVAVLVSVAFTVRALRAFAYREAVLAGTFAGVALAFKPANALFLGGPLVALALARRWTHLPLFLVSLAPALLALTLWKARGLGEVPLFAQGEATRLAAGLDDPVMVSATSWLDRTVRLDLDTWRENMSNIREFTWSARVLQFLPLAGAIAVARRSVPAAGLFLTWLLGYVVVKGAADVATVESGSFWRLIMPALPAFVLLAASVPLLVPTFVDRMGQRLAPDPGRRPSPVPDGSRRRAPRRRPDRGAPAGLAVPRPARPGGRLRRPGAGRRRHRCARWTRTSSPSRFAASATPTCSAGPTRPRARAPSTASTAPRPRAASPTWSARTAGSTAATSARETLVTTRDALVRRSRSARRRGLPGRRRGELARRRHAR